MMTQSVLAPRVDNTVWFHDCGLVVELVTGRVLREGQPVTLAEHDPE